MIFYAKKNTTPSSNFIKSIQWIQRTWYFLSEMKIIKNITLDRIK